ncbi:MAG: bifunctional hydroxymethylpyrimidine kinase/phosphomethylpyrimidine kinase [Alphaproteobacteria bacterium]|nr:bifunctional hydroxymethylpyrimidine kinase/phosphomethylpyrimidine kinase [Alphaproteobacteria bacterium]HCP01722.1 bifunctional hydroxymethylpyrimidine kinase/phosphomethylpyrimidine kinase [Rhodospirillaceae bacterium]
MDGRVLIVAGSDSGGGAGIQADIKAVTALGGFAMTAVTALTAQNSEGVHGVFGIETDFIAQQMRVVLDDLGADCIKTGMLHSVEVIETVVRNLADANADIPLVADPVMVAKGGARLLDAGANAALVSLLVPLARVLTPNAPEAAALTGLTVADEDGQRRAAEKLVEQGAAAVLVKGGHIDGPEVVDFLVTPDEAIRFADPRIDTRHTHGTGCTLASSIAVGIAQGLALADAVARARTYVRAAIASAPGYGRGYGPLDHGVTFDPGRLDS